MRSGGDTLVADMCVGYDGLDEEMRGRIDGLRAVRDYSKVSGHTVRAEDREAMRVQYPPVEHPVVRVHLDTGRRMRFVDRSFADHVVGLDRDGSDTLIDLLASEAETVEYHCRFAGSEHAVAFWDSRSTQLHASSDDWPRRRVMERASVAGERPRG